MNPHTQGEGHGSRQTGPAIDHDSDYDTARIKELYINHYSYILKWNAQASDQIQRVVLCNIVIYYIYSAP